MTITPRTTKTLWAAAAGRCAFSDCRKRLSASEEGEFAQNPVGEMAHIRGKNPTSNRHDSNQTEEQRDDYSNLVLLCPNHHSIVDRKENEQLFSVDVLLGIKAAHEAFVLERLQAVMPADKLETSRQIAALLAENHEAWKRFGPLSDIARKNPHSDAAHQVWIRERLTTIVPNNRKIADLLREAQKYFDAQERNAIASFLLHQSTYERWVRDEVGYEGVSPFPTEFAEMIERAASAGIQ